MIYKKDAIDIPVRVISVFFLGLVIVIIGRLFILQILQHDYYATFALDTHEIYKKLNPKRGTIYFQDTRTKEEYQAASMREYYTVYAVPKEITDKTKVEEYSEKISEILKFDEEEKENLKNKLFKIDDPYEPIAPKIDEITKAKLENLELIGVYTLAMDYRYYPEINLASNVLGFYGSDSEGRMTGKYGLEGYFDKELSGQTGFLMGEKTAGGSMITLADINSVSAEDGKDLLLTIDRTLQFKACERLKKGMEDYKATSASLVMINPNTGAILAMCSFPDFDPNNYSKVDDIRSYNNTGIFTPYEPGSVFKPITMSSALDLELVEPYTYFEDPCKRSIGGFTIHNALDKCFGSQTMTGVLENSINTGMIWVEEKLGIDEFVRYVEKFGFGKKTGITLNTENAGDLSSLQQNGPVYGAVASFGQGITVTPLQLAVAYCALANNGKLLKPYIVEEIRYPSGKIEKTAVKVIDNVISSRASKLITGMLVSVVDNGQARNASVPGYYIAGKTGTAQIAGVGGYTEETNHTFVGFAPADNPKFVLVIKYEKPQRAWADSTTAPTFADIAKFTLQYYGIPEER